MLALMLTLACALSWFVLSLVGLQTWIIAAMSFGLGLIAGLEIAARYPGAVAQSPPPNVEHIHDVQWLHEGATPQPDRV